MPFAHVKPVIDLSVRKLCVHPYYNHPKGCPNYNKRKSCPPHCSIIENEVNLDKPIWAIWNIFDFRVHCDRMKEKHPKWSKRQIECCLYWQPTARKELKEEIVRFQRWHPHILKIIRNPEASGVDVTSTMKSIGIKLEWPPVIKTYQVVLAGYSKIGEKKE